MREDCCHFQTRAYAGGEVARFCTLDLAPEAPWRCPDHCPRYERLALHTGFEMGSLARPPVEPEPEAEPEDIAAVLDDAEQIVNEAAPLILAELEVPRVPWWRRLGRRRGEDGGDGDEFRLSDR
jgi:hypothetical protein